MSSGLKISVAIIGSALTLILCGCERTDLTLDGGWVTGEDVRVCVNQKGERLREEKGCHKADSFLLGTPLGHEARIIIGSYFWRYLSRDDFVPPVGKVVKEGGYDPFPKVDYKDASDVFFDPGGARRRSWIYKDEQEILPSEDPASQETTP